MVLGMTVFFELRQDQTTADGIKELAAKQVVVTPQSLASTSSKKRLSGGAIAGIVIGSIVGAILIGVAGFYIYRYRKTHTA